MKLPRPLSHSSITLYGECPQKYKFRYVDAIPEKPRHFFSYGQSVHSALEFFYGVKTPVPPALEELLRVPGELGRQGVPRRVEGDTSTREGSSWSSAANTPRTSSFRSTSV